MARTTRDVPRSFAPPNAPVPRDTPGIRGDVLRLAKKIVLLVLPLAIVPIVSVIGDAGHVYHARGYAEAVAARLNAGRNVTGAGEFDQRYFESAFVRNLHVRPQLLVLGSSRAMILSSHLLGRPLVNSAVSGATLNDIFAIYELYRERDIVPQAVLLSLDPWTMNEQNTDRRWRSLSAEANALRSRLGLRTSPPSPWETLADLREKITGGILSPQYFRESFRMLVLRRTGVGALSETDSELNAETTRLQDGAVTWDSRFRGQSPADAMRDAQQYVTSNPVYGLTGFTSVTADQREALRSLLAAMHADGVDVRIVLFPYHPLVYRALNHSPHYVSPDDVERVIRSIADETRIPVAGSFSPAAMGLDSIDFYDAMHPHDAPSRTIALRALR